MQVQSIPTELLKPYSNNAKKHPPEQVERIANSIREFGWQQPLVVDGDHNVIIGHGRLLAALQLKQKHVPCVKAGNLTDEQIRALRLSDNKTNESEWDLDALDAELDGILDIDMSDFGFNLDGFDDSKAGGAKEAEEDGNAEYEAFVDKFKPKLTTDDCYTPEAVYEAVKAWAVETYGLHGREIVRPFWPGGDYQNHEYPVGCAVIDNPPFSIAAEIIRFYNERQIDYFLFANHLTLFTAKDVCNYIVTDAAVVYENGAHVTTSFRTNLGEYLIDTAPSLYEAVAAAQANDVKSVTSYAWPEELCTAAGLGGLADKGVSFKVRKGEAAPISNLDGAKEIGKSVFGGGFLLSQAQAKAQAKAKAQARAQAMAQAQAQAQAMAQAQAQKPRIPIELSERELAIVDGLGAGMEPMQ